MGTQASFTREGGSLIFTGSSSNADASFGAGQQSGSSNIYDLKWDSTLAAIMVKYTQSSAWSVLIPFVTYDYLETP